jgi:hypothetical protein
MKQAKFIPFENKKDAQVEMDRKMTPAQRWTRMWELIAVSIAFSPNKTLKIFDKPDKFITLKRIT